MGWKTKFGEGKNLTLLHGDLWDGQVDDEHFGAWDFGRRSTKHGVAGHWCGEATSTEVFPSSG